MAKYTKKPVLIEAALYDGHDVGEPNGTGRVISGSCPTWFMRVVRNVSQEPTASNLREDEVVSYDGCLWIAGEIYPCKPEIFRMTYDGPIF